MPEAQAIVHRMHLAFDKPCPEVFPISDWLVNAAKEGSLVALDELSQLNLPGLKEVQAWKKSILRLNWQSKYPQDDFDRLRKYDFLSQHGWEEILGVPFGECSEPLHAFVCQILSDGIIKDIHAPFLNKGHSLIHIFAAIGSPDSIRTLAKLGADLNQQAPISGQTPLSCACLTGNSQAAKYLMDVGVEIQIPDITGATPLHYTTYLPEIECDETIRRLVRGGLDINQTSVARKNSHLAFIGENMVHCGTPLHWAVGMRRTYHIGLFLELGANPLASDNMHEMHRQLVNSRIMSSTGFQPRAEKFDSPLALAVENHQSETVKQLDTFMKSEKKHIDLDCFASVALRTTKAKMMYVPFSSCSHNR
jgi:ankyrin repeat protein